MPVRQRPALLLADGTAVQDLRRPLTVEGHFSQKSNFRTGRPSGITRTGHEGEEQGVETSSARAVGLPLFK